MIFLAIATGTVKSWTVTVAIPVLTFPLLSVTVNVTVLAPIFEHVNVLGETANVAIPQASLEPLLICEAVILALPELFNCTVMFWVTTNGLTVSTTVTIAVPVLILPLLSVTVKVTVLAPVFEQVNVLGETANVAIPQASVDPLFTWAPVKFTFPVASNCTVMFLVTTVGTTVSPTVTVAVAVFTFPFTSVTDNVTVFAPILEQVNVLGETL